MSPGTNGRPPSRERGPAVARSTRGRRLNPLPSPSLFESFEQTARRSPDLPAARGARHAFTYGELAGLAGSIGGALLRDGTAAGSPVALLLEHDALAAAAQLAVYAAGKVCIPLDPGQPLARIALILGEAGAGLLLCDAPNRAAALALAARAASGVRCLCLEDAGAVAPPAPMPEPRGGPACVIFTSGSTGTPKGACQGHGTIQHDVLDLARLHRLGPGDRVAVLAPASSIAGTTALFAALLSGAAAHFFDVRGRSPGELAGWVRREQITFYQSVTTLFRRMALGAAPACFGSVRAVRLFGEAATRTEWRLWRERFPADGVFETGLGSSEACMVSRWIADRRTRWDDPVLPAGRPLPGKELRLVAVDGAPVPPGAPGEIIVRSEFLFEGYWGRPELTATVLAPDAADPSRRLLRTGDLGRLLPDGTLVHLGRRDGQVKVRGNRVEVAEVETALRELAPVRDAAVVPLEVAPGSTRLVAFVAAETGPLDGPRELRARLRERLPSCMVPDAITTLPELPLLPGGKVDRASLAARAREERPAGVAADPPRTPEEEAVAGIVEDALDAVRVGRDQHLFLDLGADSLTAAQIIEEIALAFGRRLPAEALGEAPTVAALAERVTAAHVPARDHLLVHPRGRRPPLFAVCGAFGSALRLLALGLRLDPDQPLCALQPPAMDWAGVGAETIEAMAEHHLRALRHLAPRGPYRLLGTSLGGLFAFEIACRLREMGEEVALLAMVDTFPPDCVVGGDLSRGERRDWTLGAPADTPLAAAGVRVARQHRAALDAYRLGRRFDGDILYFRCTEPPVSATHDRRRLWSHFAAGVRTVEVPGLHGHFHEEPQLSAILGALRRAL